MLNCTTYFRDQVLLLQQAVANAERERLQAEKAQPMLSNLKAGREKSRAVGAASQARIVEYVRTHPGCSRRDISNGIELTFRNTGNHLTILVAAGRVKNVGSRCRAKYLVVER
jgi:predicted transcriptional regulator